MVRRLVAGLEGGKRQLAALRAQATGAANDSMPVLSQHGSRELLAAEVRLTLLWGMLCDALAESHALTRTFAVPIAWAIRCRGTSGA
jgi:hypothetical protein